MKISKTTLFAIVFVSLLVKCTCVPYIHKYFLTEDEKEWANAYNTNDTVLFICDVGNDLDTMIINDVGAKNPRNHNPLDWEDKDLIAMMLETSNEINGGGAIVFRLIHNDKNYPGALSIWKQKKKGYASLSFYLKEGFRWDNRIPLKPPYMGDFFFPVPDRLYLNSDSNKVEGYHEVWDDIRELTWDKYTGLESYSFEDSVYYRFYKRIPGRQSKTEQ